MDHFDVTTGVLDSWNLLEQSTRINPFPNTFISRNKGVQVSSLNLFTSSTSVLLKKTSYTPVFNSISAGYYPVFGGFYKTCPTTHDKPLIHVTVSPRSQKPINETRKRKQRKKPPNNSDHSVCSKKIYIVVQGPKKDKVYAIETANARIFKEINDNQLLSECMIKSYIRSMNKAKKKNPDKVKEKGNQLKTIPECSLACAYMNMNTNKEKNASPEKSGSASPRSPVRSSFRMATKVDSINSITTTQRRTKSSDKSGQDDNAKAKSPVRPNRQKAKLIINQTNKTRKEETISPDRFSFISGKRSIESVIAAEKRKSPERYEKRASSPARGGRIRITGRLGIDENDKCVLKCDATLNDEPIPTQFQGATCAMLPICFQARNEEVGSSKKQHDATVQAKERGARILANTEIRKESQATQVDFLFSYLTTKNPRDQCSRGKIMQQCACVNTDNNVRPILEAKEDPGLGLKKQHSPLIVISVYSKNASSESSSGDVKQQNKTTEQKKENKTGRSRSPSPAKSPKKLGGKKSESRVNASTSKKTVRETTRKEIRSKANQSQSKTLSRSTTVTKSKFETKTNKNKSAKSQKTPPQSRRSVSPQINQEEDKAELKRALIDDFTKTYTEQIQRNAHLEIPLQTKHNVSNITIDIEGDSEYYNVKLEQDVGKLNTELTVRKPNRRDKAGDMIMGETDSTSMENFLYMPEEEPRKRSFSQTLMFDGTDLTMNSELETENELNVKDSIEISHKREHRTSSDGNRERNDISIEVDSIKFAPDRHFQGDDCSISDPDARDREIRRLLGIDKGVKKFRSRPSQPSEALDKGCQVSFRSSLTTNTTSENLPNTVILTRPLCLMNCKQNIQLLYKLSLRKPIVLTISQYAKLRRTIYKNSLTKHKSSAKWYNLDESRFKIDKTDTKSQILHYNKYSQTDNELLDQHCTTSDANTYIIDKINSADLVRDDNSTCKDGQYNSNTEKETLEHSSNANCTQQVINYKNYYMHNVLRTVYIAGEENIPAKKELHKKAASVKDIQYLYRQTDTRQKVRFSSSDSANYISRDQKKQDSCSVHTIFKCHRKSVTPNLGTSAYSLCNGEPFASRIKFFEDSVGNVTPKKPFLRRLISCLVFRVSPAENKNPRAWHECGSTRSSFDSYHISTSLGAVEMTSSLYDTTASFYSNHSAPAAKTRHGFLSSVRGYLNRNH